LFTYSFVLFKGEKGLQRYEKKRILPRLFLSLGQSPGDKVDFLPLREWIFFVMGSVFCFVCLFYPSFCGGSLALFPKNMRTFAPLLAFLLGRYILCGMLHNILRDITRPILSQNQ